VAVPPTGSCMTPHLSTICDPDGSCAKVPRSVQNSMNPTLPERKACSAWSNPVSSGVGIASAVTACRAAAAPIAASVSRVGLPLSSTKEPPKPASRFA